MIDPVETDLRRHEAEEAQQAAIDVEVDNTDIDEAFLKELWDEGLREQIIELYNFPILSSWSWQARASELGRMVTKMIEDKIRNNIEEYK